MKPKFYSLLALLLTIAAMAITPFQHVKAESDVVYTLEAVNGKTTGYATYEDVTVNNMIWNAPGNQSLGAFWRIGGGKSAVMDNEAREITGKTPMNAEVSSIMVCFNGVSNAAVTVNSISVTVATDVNFVNVVEQVVLDNIAVQKGIADSIVLAPVAGGSWPIGCYYKLTFRISNAAKVNAGIDFTKAVFYGKAGVEPLPWTPVTVQLSSASVNAFGWTQVYLWAWVTTETTSTDLFPAWPGVPVYRNDETGWYSYTFEEPLDGNLNIIWSNGASNAQQTVDIPVNGSTCYELSSHVDGMGHLTYSIVDCPDAVNPNQPTITVGQAKTIGDSLAVGAKSDTTYNIVGYVTSIKENAFDGEYANMTFYIDDVIGGENRFFVYRGKPSVELQIGDFISVKTKVYNYNGTIETETNMPVTLLEKAVNTPLEQGIYDYTKMGTTIDQWEGTNAIYNASESTEIKYVFDITANNTASVNVIDEPNILFQIRNGANKAKAFNISPGKYFEFGGKNGVVVLRNTQAGDRIILNVAAKGYSDASMLDPAGEYPKNATVLTEDLTLPAKDETTGEYYWRDIEFLSNGGDIRIKEFASGFRIRTITIAPQNDIDTTQVLTVSQAIQFASTLPANQNTPNNIAVEGYVVQASRYDQALGYQTFWIADAIGDTPLKLQAYRATPQMNGEPCQVLEGDKVILHGPIQRYINASQEQICEAYAPQVEFIALADGDHALPEIQQVNVKQVFNYFGAMPAGKVSTYCFDVTGYVTGIIENGFDQYGNMTFWMADTTDIAATSNANGALQVYRGVVKQELKVGDYISVRTRIRCDFINNNTDSVLRSQSSAPVTLLHREQTDSTPQIIKIDCTQPITMEYYENTRDWYLYSNNGTYGVSLDFFSNNTQSPVGVYSPNDFDYQYTNIYVGTTETKHTTVTSAEAQVIETKDSVLVNATLLGADGNTYEVYMFQQKPAGTDTIVPSGVPTPAYLSQLGYDLINNVVFCINFTGDATLCNGVYFVGTFSNWDTDFNNCPKFMPLKGYEGWYVAEAPYTQGFQGKPIQAKADSSFTWENQCGDYDAWTYVAGKQMDIYSGAPSEANLYFNAAGAYIYEMSYWKKHINPCNEDPVKTVYVALAAPKNSPQEGVEIIGTFDNWVGTRMDTTGNNNQYMAVVKASASDEFKFRQIGTWNNQILYLNDNEVWTELPNLPFGEYWEDGSAYNVPGSMAMIINLSDSTRYRWTYDIPYTPDTTHEDTTVQIDPICHYTLEMTDSYGDGWNGGYLTVIDGTQEMTYTFSSGASYKVSVPYYGNEVSFVWNSGSYDGEVGFTVLSSNGIGLFHHEPNTALADGEQVFLMKVSPCMDGLNPYIPQDIQAVVTDEYKLRVTWTPVEGAASYKLQVYDPQGTDIAKMANVTGNSYLSAVLRQNGEYWIRVITLDATGLQLGEAVISRVLSVPSIPSVTIQAFAPTDCNMDVTGGLWLVWNASGDTASHIVPMTTLDSHLFVANFAPNAPSYDYYLINKPSLNADSISRTGIWTNRTETEHCSEILYAPQTSIHYMRMTGQCNFKDHNYDISNLQAAVYPGRVEFTWDAQDIEDKYYLYIWDSNLETKLDTIVVNNATSYTWAVDDKYDGMQVMWSVYPAEPYAHQHKAGSLIELQKGAITNIYANAETKDSKTIDMSWQFSTDNLHYLVEIEYDHTVYKREIVTAKEYHYTAILQRTYDMYVTPLNVNNEVLGARVYAGSVAIDDAPAAITDLKSTVSGNHITFTWKTNAPKVKIQLDLTYSNGNSVFISQQDLTEKTVSFDVQEDGNYKLYISPYIEYEPGKLLFADDWYYVSAQVFTSKTYHVDITPTEGGYLYPLEPSGDYAEGYTFNVWAYPYAEYYFDGWSDGLTANNRTIYVDGAISLQAIFKQYLKLRLNESVGGNIAINTSEFIQVDSMVWVKQNQTVSLTAFPEDGYEFVQWSDGVKSITRQEVITQDAQFTAIFREIDPTKQQYLVQIFSPDETQGTVNAFYGMLAEGTTLEITATPNDGYEFVQWSDSVKTNPRQIVVNQAMTIYPIFALKKVTLKIDAALGGTVNSAEANGIYNYGEMVVIKATPNERYHFLSWSDGNRLAERSIKLTKDTFLTATFEQNSYYALNLSAENGGKILAVGEAEWKQSTLLYFDPSQSVIIMAKADEGYIFNQWSDGVTDSVRTLYLNKDTAITALFTPVYKLTVNINFGGIVEVAGNYIASEADTYSFAAGEKVTLTAKPNEGFMFSNWENSDNNRVREITMTQNMTVTAVFKDASTVPTRTVSIATSGDGLGTVSPVDSAYYVGESFTVTATPNDGSVFVAWSDGITTNPRTVLVGDKDIAFDAIFSLISYKLTVSVEGMGGTVNDSVNTKTYHYGDIVVLEAKPDTNYHFLNWSDGVKLPYRSILITQDTVVKAFFEGDLFTITFVNYNDSVIETKQFPYGAMPSCSVTPTKPADSKKEYVFAGWQPQLAPVTGDATYKAVYTEKIAAYTVTFYDWNYEEIDVQKVKPGEAAVIPEDPTRKGYEFTGWKMDTDGATMADLKNVQSDLDVVATYRRAEGIEQITNDQSSKVNKICIDGQIYILRDNKLYTLTGQKVK